MPTTKLSFTDILSESFRVFFNNLPLFFHLVTIPWILSLLLRIGGDFIEADSMLAMLTEKAIDVIPTVMFLVGWMRALLLGPQPTERLPGLGWSARETAFLIYLIRIAGFTFLLLAAFTMIAGAVDPADLAQASLDPEVARREAMAAPLGIGFFISALMALRVSFGLAATAIDAKLSPRQAWALSRGSAWVIIGVLFVIFFSSAIATVVAALAPLALIQRVIGTSSAALVVAWTAAILVNYAGAALAATAQTVIFRRLSGPNPST